MIGGMINKKSSIDTIEEEDTGEVEMVFLHASPNILKDFDTDRQKHGSNAPPALDFRKEQSVIKQTL